MMKYVSKHENFKFGSEKVRKMAGGLIRKVVMGRARPKSSQGMEDDEDEIQDTTKAKEGSQTQYFGQWADTSTFEHSWADFVKKHVGQHIRSVEDSLIVLLISSYKTYADLKYLHCPDFLGSLFANQGGTSQAFFHRASTSF